jgi:hypothetical protein
LPREIEIWFVVWRERLYLFAETREAAGWVKNIRRNPKVMVRIGEWRTDATARVLDGRWDRYYSREQFLQALEDAKRLKQEWDNVVRKEILVASLRNSDLPEHGWPKEASVTDCHH